MNSSAHSRASLGDYDPRHEYMTDEVATRYEEVRYKGALGRYRWRREQEGIASLLSCISADEVVSGIDCPTGIGRWLGAIDSVSPEVIVCVDISPAMLRAARDRGFGLPSHTLFAQAAAEELPFDDDIFDLVFCHALAKHLPIPMQAGMLKSLARVSRRYVVCSFSVGQGLSGVLRHLRRTKAQTVSPTWVRDSATSAGLLVRASSRTSTPMGVERSFLFEKKRAWRNEAQGIVKIDRGIATAEGRSAPEVR
jgi:ubiquinone/menaquinone biosynthesis C-methylase UbiE